MCLNVENISRLSIKEPGQNVIGMLSYWPAIETVKSFTSIQHFFFKTPGSIPNLSFTSAVTRRAKSEAGTTSDVPPKVSSPGFQGRCDEGTVGQVQPTTGFSTV